MGDDARPCPICGGPNPDIGLVYCPRCRDLCVWDVDGKGDALVAARAEREATVRAGTCVDCGVEIQVESDRGLVPKRCKDCTPKHNKAQRNARDAAAGDGVKIHRKRAVKSAPAPEEAAVTDAPNSAEIMARAEEILESPGAPPAIEGSFETRVDAAWAEAVKFTERCQRLADAGYRNGSRLSGSLRRQSLELSQALAEMRR